MKNLLPSLEEIEAVIRRLGVPGSYLGLPRLTRAVAVALEGPDAVRSVIKRIYGPVSRERGVTVSVLERRIRTLWDHIWDQGDRKLLEGMAGHRLSYSPHQFGADRLHRPLFQTAPVTFAGREYLLPPGLL